MGEGASKTSGNAKEFYAHKLFAPAPRPDVIRRETILNRVFEVESYRVFLLQAPAGYGKSMTLHQVKSACEERRILTAWLTFDEADNDTRRFLIHFEALLTSARGDAVASAANEIDDVDRGHRSDWAIDRLVRLGQPVALFLDDFQALENPAILGFFREFLQRVPLSARIFIGSRSMPEMGIARLLVNEQGMVLRPEDIRFSPAEAEQFFAGTKNIGIANVEVDRIY